MYNYAIIGYNLDLYKYCYSDVLVNENVRYIPNNISKKLPPLFILPKLNAFIYFLYRLHHSAKINKIINLPLKKIWFGLYFKNDFSGDNPLCFIFFGRNYYLESYGYIEYLKKKYPNSKHVCIFQDLIKTHENIDINHVKDVFDLVISFDHIECKKYGLEYHQLVYSHFPIEESPIISKSDVYFLGKAKDRLDKIIKTYEYLRSKNLKCNFYLVDVEKEKQVYSEEIHYIDNMPYIENLQHVISTRCLLEIMQQNGHGYTQRICEAIAFDKKILTNNIEVKNAPFYNDKFISVYSDSTDIDISFLKDGSNDIVDYNFKEQQSPRELLSFVEKKLDKN